MSSPKAKQHASLLHRYLEHIWYNDAPSGLLLRPLSFLFCQIAKQRKQKQILLQQSFPVPVIVIGNINIGGTGKTPLILKLVEILLQNGHKPAIITRGYKGKSEVWPLEVTAETAVEDCGDEAKLLALRSGVPVIADANRNASIQRLVSNHQISIILSDDGLQHYKMARTMEIAVVDGQRGLGNGRCLPAGPLREKPSRLAECDLVISNGLSTLTSHTMWVHGDIIVNLKSGQRKELTSLKNTHLLTGIGNPARFIDTVKSSNINLLSINTYPDHHNFTAQDLNVSASNKETILITEKDAVKCLKFSAENVWYLEVEAKLDATTVQAFLDRIKSKTHG